MHVQQLRLQGPGNLWAMDECELCSVAQQVVVVADRKSVAASLSEMHLSCIAVDSLDESAQDTLGMHTAV